MKQKRIQLDRSKLLGFKLEAPKAGQSGAKVGARLGAKLGGKVGGKGGGPPPVT